MDVGLDARIAEGAGKNRIEVAAQHGEAVGRDGHSVAEIAIGAPVEFAHLTSAPDARITLRAWGITSWPIPSPGMTAIRFLEVFCGSTAENLTQANLNEYSRCPGGRTISNANFQLASGSSAYRQ
jgi:hypothetical protein